MLDSEYFTNYLNFFWPFNENIQKNYTLNCDWREKALF